LQRVIVENPTDATELRYSLAAVQEQAGKAADAEKTLTALAQAAKQPDEQARANTALAQFFEKESRWEQAALAYEDVLRDNPGSNPARIGLWRVRDKQKQPAAAATFLESLALAGADNPNLAAVTSVGLLYQQVGTPEKYVEFTRRLSEKYAKSRGALNVYALALLQGVGSPQEKERRAAAADVYRQMIALDARDADAFYQLAIQEEALGQKEPAIAAYRSAAAITSGEPASVTAAQSARAALKRLGVAESAAAPTATPQTAPTSAPAPAGNRTGPDVPKSGS
jgi:tetratricopeptide (TPR) repeat protein